MRRFLVMAVALMTAAGGVSAAERHSNGLGGGRWSDPLSWHDKVLPAATDVVVVASGDTVQFDLESANCAGILIDPDGVLALRPDEQARMLRVTGPVESYGMIRADANRMPRALLTLRVESDDPTRRVVTLFAGAGLLLYGSTATESGLPGISLETAMLDGKPAQGTINAGTDVQLDLSAVRLSNWVVKATGLDNTGFKPNQRLNLVGCRFEGYGRVELNSCDSAVIANCRFDWPDAAAEAPGAAIGTASCKLTDLRLNRMTGRYPAGIDMGSETDGALTSNTVDGAACGLSFRSCPNLMLRANATLACADGLRLRSSSGAVEGHLARANKRSFYIGDSTAQLADVRVEENPTNGVPFYLQAASVTLLNVQAGTNEIVRIGAAPGKEPWVTCMHYLVVKAAGVPPGGEVSVGTAAASGGGGALADLNVRNSPARMMANGLTPLPRTLRCLVVRGWRIENNGRYTEAPFYDLKVLGPPDGGTGVRPVLKAQVIEPRESWYRPGPDAPAPTLEVK